MGLQQNRQISCHIVQAMIMDLSISAPQKDSHLSRSPKGPNIGNWAVWGSRFAVGLPMIHSSSCTFACFMLNKAMVPESGRFNTSHLLPHSLSAGTDVVVIFRYNSFSVVGQVTSIIWLVAKSACRLSAMFCFGATSYASAGLLTIIISDYHFYCLGRLNASITLRY